MDKISTFIADHIMKNDSGIDAGVLTRNLSSMSLDSSDSSFGSNVDVLNRARIDSMDGDLSIKEELNQARILSQDFTLDSVGLSADEDVGETHINVSIKLTNNKQTRNKENIIQSNKYSKFFKSDNGKKVVCRQFNNGKQVNSKYNVNNKLTIPSPKAKPLSPNKNNNNCTIYESPNITTRAGPKKLNTRKKRTTRNSFVISPPKLSQAVTRRAPKGLYNGSPCQPGVKNPVTQSNYNFGSKTTKRLEFNSKLSSVCTPSSVKSYHLQGKKSPRGKDDSVYSTPVQTPSKLIDLMAPLSPNVTTRTPSPLQRIMNSPYLTIRSPPSSQKIPSSRSPSPTCSWYSAEDSLEFLPNELNSSYCHASPNTNRGKPYFSPLFDDSAIVEASCSGKKYFNFPEVVNLKNAWTPERQQATEGTKSFYSDDFSKSPVKDDESNNTKMGHSLLGERLGRVLNLPVSPLPKCPDEQSYVDFQKFLDRLEGTTKVRKKLSSSLDDSKSFKSSPTQSPLCCDSRLPDELSEAELDEITWIHTTCNGQQVASRVFFGDGSNDSFSVFPPPRSPRHLKWSEKLVEEGYDKIENKKTTSTPLRSILKKRPDHFVFPYNGDEPSPYLITRTRQVHSPV